MDSQTLIKQVREQIQEDIITFCDGLDNNFITKLCQIVVDNFKQLKEIE